MNEEKELEIKEAYSTDVIKTNNVYESTPICKLLIDILDSGIEFGFIDRLELDIKQTKAKYNETDETSKEFEDKLQEASYVLMCLYLKDNQIEKAKSFCESFDSRMEEYIFNRIRPSYPVIIENDNYYCAMLKVEIAEKRNINVNDIKFWEGIYNIEYPESNYRLPEQWQPEIKSLVAKENSFVVMARNFSFVKTYKIRYDASSDRYKMNLFDIQKLKEYLIYKKNVHNIRIAFEEGIEDVIFDLDIKCNCKFFVKLPTTARRIGGSLFNNNSNIDVVDISESRIEKIEEGTFENSSIRMIKLPQCLYSIGKNAFLGCKFMEKINLSNTSIKFLKQGCFRKSGIKDISFPSSLRVIEVEAFSECKNLKSLDLSKTELSLLNAGLISESGLSKIKLGENVRGIGFDVFSECNGLKKVDLSATSVEKIGPYAFYNANIRKIKFPNELKEIDYEAFSGCYNLETLDLSKTNIERIAGYAFYNSGIKKVKFPKTLKYLSEDAFYGCKNLKKLDLQDTMVKKLSTNSFGNSGINEIKF
jgi:Leucine-rich repeat (LRR) protein